MKKLLPALILSLFVLFTKQTFAHVLITDGSIGAVLHIDPDDDPIAGEQSSFFFDFKDKENKFDPKICDCQFQLFEGGKQIYVQPLFSTNTNPSLTNASVFFTFPKRDIYTMKVIGKPQLPNTFTPFVLSYDIRVSRTTTTNSRPVFFPTGHLIHYIGIGFIALFVLFAIVKQTFQNRKQKK